MATYPQSHRILILGGSGGLGKTLLEKWTPRHQCFAPPRRLVDFECLDEACKTVADMDFDAVINCAALARPDDCEDNVERARCINALAPGRMAEIARRKGARFLQISTDFVFAGDHQQTPLPEASPALPLSIYGQTKRDGEKAVLEACPGACVARVSWLFGMHRKSHADHVIERGLQEPQLTAIADKWSVPTFDEDLADWLEVLLTHPSSPSGLYHLTPSGSATWHEWTVATLEVAREIGLPMVTSQVVPVAMAEFKQLKAARPTYSVLSNTRFEDLWGSPLPHWRPRLSEYLHRRYGPISPIRQGSHQ